MAAENLKTSIVLTQRERKPLDAMMESQGISASSAIRRLIANHAWAYATDKDGMVQGSIVWEPPPPMLHALQAAAQNAGVDVPSLLHQLVLEYLHAFEEKTREKWESFKTASTTRRGK